MECPARCSSEFNTLEIFCKHFEDQNYMGGYRMPNSTLWLPRICLTANLANKLGALGDSYMRARKHYRGTVLELGQLGFALSSCKAGEGV